MSDTPRTPAVVAAALAASAASFANLTSDAETKVVPLNLHEANRHAVEVAGLAAEFATVVAEAPAADVEARVAAIEQLLTDAGIKPEAK